MSTFEMRTHVGPDGKLLVYVPGVFADSDVRVIIERVLSRPRKTAEDWRAFIRSVAGSIPDFPDVPRPGPDAYEPREPLE